ncbi:formate dehydrogenase accessory sulfurtransferase FdhD [Roseivirga sp. E12]|uniref:formate dehydrogenase accessory sulfurtransferase FdhD n=1 Tax=Roseivirga sp. E12 TaxID=2819237 RepID=UPI001ABC2FE3|nr:formate dehydrogenase accessory sulfurtransferase FdhD [Roseivirga sp. E12]MBO3697585.1 formate dehydrogenase accessory sulfurtransferase FdhD [Roseivirga sp. E12]
MGVPVQPVEVIRVGSQSPETKPDLVVSEEPLEIRIGHGESDDRKQFSVSVTMRTPGNDEALCLGFLFTEGIINSMDEVISVKYCEDLGRAEGMENLMRVELQPFVEISDEQFKRNFYTTSSCGVCGKASIDSIKVSCEALSSESIQVDKKVLFGLPDSLRSAQDVFKHTGGLHASGLFDTEGQLIAHQEDVGRHNALDKLIGEGLIKKTLPLSKSVLVLSGRISFELVQKALRAGIQMIAAVGAPSSLAVNLAEEFGMTLIGFLKDDRFNVYTGKERVTL